MPRPLLKKKPARNRILYEILPIVTMLKFLSLCWWPKLVSVLTERTRIATNTIKGRFTAINDLFSLSKWNVLFCPEGSKMNHAHFVWAVWGLCLLLYVNHPHFCRKIASYIRLNETFDSIVCHVLMTLTFFLYVQTPPEWSTCPQ